MIARSQDIQACPIRGKKCEVHPYTCLSEVVLWET